MKVPLTPVRCLRYAQEQFPQKTAIVCGHERFTYAQLGERAHRLAGALRAMGIKPGDRVAFLSTNCHRLLEAYYGVLEAGAVLLPLNIRLTPPELAFVLNDAGARVLFVEAQFLQTAELLRQSASLIHSFILLDGKPEATWFMPQNYEDLLADSSVFQPDLMEFDEDSPAELFYTSGTSAEPKGVMLTHRNIYLHGLHAALALRVNQDTVELHTIPLFHANGWGNVHSVTLAGGTHVMIHRFDPVQVCLLIERERVRSCNLVPTMATALVNCPWLGNYDLSSLQRVILGGAASSPPLVRQVEEKLQCACYSGYGLTETSPILTLSPLKPGMKCDREQRYAAQAMAGFAMPGVELRVVDGEDRDVPRDAATIGEILARSDGVMQGYWRQEEATEAALRGGWFHTGDLATVDQNNYVLIVDRKKDMIVSGGENISSLEVEKVLLAHPSVYEVAVIPVPDDHWTEVPKAIVVLKAKAAASESELIEFCRSRLARYKCPKSVDFVESLPKNGAGKILKKELRASHRPAPKIVSLVST